MKKIIQHNLLIVLLAISNFTEAQVAIGSDIVKSDNVLEVNVEDKGILFDYVELKSTTDPFPFSEHINGMIVLNNKASNTNSNTSVLYGMYYNDGTKWNLIGTSSEGGGSGISPKVSIGQIKSAFINKDHDGWYILDGRSLTALPDAAQKGAKQINLLNALPDSNQRYIVGKTANEAVFNTNNNTGLAQNNLPDIQIKGVTSAAGKHGHKPDNITIPKDYFQPDRLIFANLLKSVDGSKSDDILIRKSNTNTQYTNYEGAHTHSYNFEYGGKSEPISSLKKLNVKYFIYLGK